VNHIKIASQTQADVRIFDKIDEFFNHFHVSTMLHRFGKVDSPTPGALL